MSLRSVMRHALAGDILVRRTPVIYGHFRALLEAADTADLQERKGISLSLLSRALKSASGTSFAKTRRLNSRYDDWPYLEKETLREAKSHFDLGTLLPINTAETGGTTGIPLELRRSWQSVVFEQAVLDHLAGIHGGVDWRKAKIAVIRGDNVRNPTDMTPPFWASSNGGRRLSFSSNHLNHQTIEQYVRALQDFNPDILWVYPTSLEALCRLSSGASLLLGSLKLVVSSSEVLSSELRQETEQRFGVPVLDYYGQAERVAFSFSVESDAHYFLPLYGFTELRFAYSESSDDVYEIFGTAFWNRAQPLVRYRTGDYARLPKGLGAAQVEEIALGVRSFLGIVGRQSDYLIAPGGGHLMGIDHIPRGARDVVQMQFHQYDCSHVTIHVVPGENYSAQTANLILAKARQKIPETMKIEIVEVAAVQRTARGKAPLIFRRMSE